MSKQSVLFLAPFPPPIHGSAVVSEQIRYSRLINDTFECDYINISTSRSMPEIGRVNVRKFFRYFIAIFKTIKKLTLNKYDLCYLAIICHGKGFIKDAPFVIICKIFHKKILIHQHNKGLSEDIDNPLFSYILHYVYKKAKVILLSWRLYPDIESVVPRSNVYICPNGIADNNYPIQNQTNAIPHILIISNLLFAKGIIVLLDSLEIVKEKGIDFICDFVGAETTDVDKTYFNNEVSKRRLTSYVKYHGTLLGEEKRLILEQSDLFVLPSYNEAFPLVILEAMRNSLPIITTNVGGIPDQVYDSVNGFIINPGDSSALAGYIELLLKDKDLRERMGVAGYQIFRDHFTEKQFERNIRDILLKCTYE